MNLRGSQAILGIATLLLWVLVPTGLAQIEEQAPLSVTGNLGFGYSSVDDGAFSRNSAVATGDADVGGYWRDPRILLYHFDPYVGYGNSGASGMEVANRGKGFGSNATFLGGSSFPLTVSYQRSWQDIPSYSNNGNVLGSMATRLTDHSLTLDSGVYLHKLPPLWLHYGSGGSATDYAGISDASKNSYNAFSAGTSYVWRSWNFDGGYSRNHNDMSRVNLVDSTATLQPETANTREMHFEAQGQGATTSLNFIAGERKWSDEGSGFDTNTTYKYAHVTETWHVLPRLYVSGFSGYDGNNGDYFIQQALGQGTGSGLPGAELNTLNGNTVTVGGGLQYNVFQGFTLSGDGSHTDTSSNQAVSGNGSVWDVNANYMRRVHRTATLTAYYGYQHSDTVAGNLIGNSATHDMRVSYSTPLPKAIFFQGSVHAQERDIQNTSPTLGLIDSPGHNFGFTLSGSRPMSRHSKLTVDFDYTKGSTDRPLHFEIRTISIGARVESRAWQLSLHHTEQQGLAMQLGNGLIYVPNAQQAELTSLSSALSIHKSVQTILTGTYQPGSKRLNISGSYVRYGYDNQGIRVSDASLYNFVVRYRLRLLRLESGFYRSISQTSFLNNTSPFVRRQIYFEVIRQFNLF